MPTLVPIKKVPALIEAWYGWRPHTMTVYRWTQGVHGGLHKLKTIKRGSRRLTSRGELRRFMKAWSGDGGTLAIARRSADAGKRAHERAVEGLKKWGIA